MLVASKAATGEAAISGWTRFLDVALTTGSGAALHGFWKKSDGTESGTVDMTTTTSTRVASVCYRIAGATDPTVTPPESAGTTQANTVNPNPPNLAPAAGSKDYLWFALFASSHGRITSSVPAGGYGDSQTTGPNNGTATNIGIGVADRAATAASEDPGTFTTTGTGVEETAAATVVVHPAAATTKAPAPGILSRLPRRVARIQN
jgi:hypothetical protein